MKHLLIWGACATVLFACNTDKPMTEEALLAKAKEIHERVITLDTHCDISIKNFTDTVNYTQELESQVTLPKMKRGGLDVAWFIVYTGQDSLTESGYADALENAMSKFEAIHNLVEVYAPNEIELATTSADVRRIHSEGKKVAMIGIENGYPVGEGYCQRQEILRPGWSLYVSGA